MLQCGFVRANFALPIAAASYSVETTTIQNAGTSTAGTANAGAGDGNRTHVASLEGWSSTIELHPPATTAIALCLPEYYRRLPVHRPEAIGGGGWIRTSELRRGQIYSLLPLTARQPLRDRLPAGAAEWRVLRSPTGFVNWSSGFLPRRREPRLTSGAGPTPSPCLSRQHKPLCSTRWKA